MSTASITASDVRLRNAVVRQFDWDPEVDTSAIGVAAKDGVVTLTGFIDTYTGKLAAERLAKRLRGVRAVANDITVRHRVERTDPDVALDVANRLAHVPALASRVQAAVHSGHVTLTGTVEWLYQRDQAAEVLHHIRGISAILNHIVVEPKAAPRDLERRIVRAFHLDADLDAHHIHVAVDRHTVRLTGTTHSWTQREAAERAAAGAPGITRVDNQIIVAPLELPAAEGEDELC